MATPKAREDLMRAESKKTSNKPCVVCSKSGPHSTVVLAPDTYFFVCQPCGGAHRSISHKVKTVGMTDFTPAEVEQVQRGGNKEAKRFWHARLPEMPFNADLNDGKNLGMFIKMTFVDRKYVPLDGQRPAPLTKRTATAPKSELKRTNTGHTPTIIAAPASTPGVRHDHSGAAAAPPRDILGGLESFDFTEAPATAHHNEPGAPVAAQPSPYVQPPLTAIHNPSPSGGYTSAPLTAIHKPAVGTPATPATSGNATSTQMPAGMAAALKISVPAEAVEALSRGFATIVRQQGLTPIQLYGAVHQAMVAMLGNHMASLNTALIPYQQASLSAAPTSAAVVAAPVSAPTSGRPATAAPSTPNEATFSASGGFPDFELAATSPISSPTPVAPVPSSSPVVQNIMDDPLAGIGETNRRDSGNPFDDDDDVLVPTPSALQNTPPVSVIGPKSAATSTAATNGNVAAPVTAIHNRKSSFTMGHDPLQGLPSFDGPAPSFDVPKPAAANVAGGNAFGNRGGPPAGGVGMGAFGGVNNGMPGNSMASGMGNMNMGNNMSNNMGNMNNNMGNMGGMNMMGSNPSAGMYGQPHVIQVGVDQYGQPIYQQMSPNAFGGAPNMMTPNPGMSPNAFGGATGYPAAATGAPFGYPGMSPPNAGGVGMTAFGGAPQANGMYGGNAFGGAGGNMGAFPGSSPNINNNNAANAFGGSPNNAFGAPANANPTVAPAAAAAPKRPELFSFLNPL